MALTSADHEKPFLVLQNKNPQKRNLVLDQKNSPAVVFNIPNPYNSELVFKNIECFEQSVKAFVDTRAGISVISPTPCKKQNLIPS